MKRMLTVKLTGKMLPILDELSLMLSDSEFIADNGSSEIKRTKVSSTLDFVVYTMEVFALDKELTDEVASLKRNLLAHVNIYIFIYIYINY